MARESVIEIAAQRTRRALSAGALPSRVWLLWSNTPGEREVLAVLATRDSAIRMLVKLYPDAKLAGDLWHANDRLLWIEPREVFG